MIWNKGLTKFTDERVAKYSKTLSEKCKKEYVPLYEKRICLKCGKEFEIDIKKSNRKYCSRTCANSHIVSDETKQKISDGLNKHNSSKNKNKNICKICGCEKGKCKRPDICNHYQILKSLIKFGFDINTKGTLDIISEFDRVKNIIKKIYNSHPSDEDLKINWSYTSGLANFHKLIKSLGIKTRNYSESQKESYLLGKANLPLNVNSCYKQGWYTTWENKKVYLRSSYEIDYAKYLDDNKIKYDVEKIRIKYFDSQKQENRISIPDFYLPDSNEIVEIKSDWTLDVQNMKDKFKEYIKLGYKPKLILNHQEIDINSI